MDIDPKNVNEISKIFSKCMWLEKISLTTRNFIFSNGDNLLKIVSNESPSTL
jgi:hypothetical protein